MKRSPQRSSSRKWTESSHKIGKCQRQACLSVGAFSILWLFEGMTLGLPTSGSAGGKMRGVAALRFSNGYYISGYSRLKYLIWVWNLLISMI